MGPFPATMKMMSVTRFPPDQLHVAETLDAFINSLVAAASAASLLTQKQFIRTLVNETKSV